MSKQKTLKDFADENGMLKVDSFLMHEDKKGNTNLLVYFLIGKDGSEHEVIVIDKGGRWRKAHGYPMKGGTR